MYNVLCACASVCVSVLSLIIFSPVCAASLLSQFLASLEHPLAAVCSTACARIGKPLRPPPL